MNTSPHLHVDDGVSATPTLTERLDRLSFTKAHRHLLVASGSGWALDALDVALISYVIVVLKTQWSLTSGDTGLIVSLGFIGMAVGALAGGRLADRLGRRSVFALTLVIFGLGSLLAAFAPSLAVLLVLRVIIGLGLGAELPVASTYVSEFAPPAIRGRIVVILEAFWAVGWLVAAFLGFLVVPLGDWGWRLAFAVGALPALYAAYVRSGLPESVRFLESRGRHEEATAVVERFEQSPVLYRVNGTPTALQGIQPAPSDLDEEVRPSRFRDLWMPGQVRATAALSTVWFFVNFSYYGAFIWMPSLLAAQGHSVVKSFGYTLVMTLAQLPGYAVAAWLIERWGRRATLSTFLVGSAASAILFGTSGSLTMVLVSGTLLSFFNLGAWGALYAISPEVFPTRLRGSGTGFAAGFGRIASILAPLAVPALLTAAGVGWLFAIFAAAFLVAGGASLALSEHTGARLAD